ncbi:hypothetical protein NLX86_03980 [Streptomyces sp. A3M-1-3]|uniref:hypothetical protein n=1 Tax=Streptomyces sp. A3M-1-3 TaxID=2962044 RepID=UPI0020B772D1|nr:hypothetical protein [Streptomyces sp. A3M-1-3]MCP3817326.1 hypothetical protein [Streptomyces sp. A3M-1-3]
MLFHRGHRPAATRPSPVDEVLLDAPDTRLGPALVAAGQGDHGPAAKLLALTRENAEWENRDRYAVRLAAFAHRRPEWFAGWLAASPGDPDALLVSAELAVRRFWESPARAELLRDTAPLIRTAVAEGDPRDPVPWRIALDQACGVDAPPDVFEPLWAEAVRRAPHHYGSHVSALLYLSVRGSVNDCFDFAERAAEDTRPGSLVQALPVRAALACLTGGGAAPVPVARIDRAADLAIALSAQYAAGDPWPAEVRNVLAYVLLARQRWAEASKQFRLIGPYATSFPWDVFTDDPLDRFLAARDAVRSRTAPQVPQGGRAGRIRSRGHYA